MICPDGRGDQEVVGKIEHIGNISTVGAVLIFIGPGPWSSIDQGRIQFIAVEIAVIWNKPILWNDVEIGPIKKLVGILMQEIQSSNKPVLKTADIEFPDKILLDF